MYHSTFSEDWTGATGLSTHSRLAPAAAASSLGCATIFADCFHLRSGVSGQAGPGGKRGVVKGLSAAARRRLILRLCQVQTFGLFSYFLTLTYPDEALTDEWSEWKRHIAAFEKRLMRAWPELVKGGYWRLEPQPRRSRREERYVPHFHLLVWSSAELPDDFSAWLARAWYEVVGSGLKKHLKRGTDLKQLDSRRAIRLYVSKYVAKEQTGADWPDQAVGRCWGEFGDVPRDPYLDIEITFSEYVLLRRLARKWLKSRKSIGYAKYLGSRRAIVGCDLIALGAESSIYLTAFRLMDAIRPGIGYVDFFIDVFGGG